VINHLSFFSGQIEEAVDAAGGCWYLAPTPKAQLVHLKMFKISADTALNRVSRYKEGRRLMVEHYSNVSFPLQHSLWPIVEDASQCYPLELLFTPRRKSFYIQKSFIQQLICNFQKRKNLVNASKEKAQFQ